MCVRPVGTEYTNSLRTQLGQLFCSPVKARRFDGWYPDSELLPWHWRCRKFGGRVGCHGKSACIPVYATGAAISAFIEAFDNFTCLKANSCQMRGELARYDGAIR